MRPTETESWWDSELLFLSHPKASTAQPLSLGSSVSPLCLWALELSPHFPSFLLWFVLHKNLHPSMTVTALQSFLNLRYSGNTLQWFQNCLQGCGVPPLDTTHTSRGLSALAGGSPFLWHSRHGLVSGSRYLFSLSRMDNQCSHHWTQISARKRDFPPSNPSYKTSPSLSFPGSTLKPGFCYQLFLHLHINCTSKKKTVLFTTESPKPRQMLCT